MIRRQVDHQEEQPDTAVQVHLRVRYAETDQMRVAHHAVYFVWFEAARAEFCRVRGIDYQAMEDAGYFLPVVEARCRYRAPARYDEEVTVTVHVVEHTRRTLRMGYRVTREATLLAEGETLQVLVGPDGRPRTFPPDLLQRFAPGVCAGGAQE
ncbi:MAG: thioesterase family protein [Chloroherpetonaceae bacterium]|nr:acyl-CoA thioesterase [Chthonomonadaceae bacterium]MDW8208559.1 thioesterase family protein [Chloroherpetonaceae bacterium]